MNSIFFYDLQIVIIKNKLLTLVLFFFKFTFCICNCTSFSLTFFRHFKGITFHQPLNNIIKVSILGVESLLPFRILCHFWAFFVTKSLQIKVHSTNMLLKKPSSAPPEKPSNHHQSGTTHRILLTLTIISNLQFCHQVKFNLCKNI